MESEVTAPLVLVGRGSSSIVWFAVMSTFGETCCPAADLPQSLKVTTHYLRKYHRERMKGDTGDVEPADHDVVVDRIERDVKLYTTGMFVAGGGSTEGDAFAAWQLISSLEPLEALRRWRMGFPLPKGSRANQDPLVATVKGMRNSSMNPSLDPGQCRP